MFPKVLGPILAMCIVMGRSTGEFKMRFNSLAIFAAVVLVLAFCIQVAGAAFAAVVAVL